MEDKTFAIFIDGDNASPNKFRHIYEKIKLKGKIRIKKIYYDFKDYMKWKDIIIDNAIEPVQCINIKSKESSDMRMIVDIIDTLHTHPHINTFIIVSSDSDFSAAARRLKEYGKNVIGIGEQQTPKILTNACDEFIILQNEDNKNEDLFDSKKKNNLLLSEKLKIIEYFKINEYYYTCPLSVCPFPIDKLESFRDHLIIKNDIIYIVADLIKNINIIKDNCDKSNPNLSYLSEGLTYLDPKFHHSNWKFQRFSNLIETLFSDKIKIKKQNNGAYIEFIT